MNQHLLSIKDVHFKTATNDVPILSDIALDVHAGDCIILIGSNGSGKSSLLKTICGLIKPTKGLVDTKGSTITSMNQDPDLSTFSELTVYENYCMAVYKQKGSCTPTKAQAVEYLRAYNPKFEVRLDSQCKRLSGGERQALGLALCLMHKPQLVLLDEHTSALDPAISKNLMELTASQLAQSGSSAIICTHQLSDALQFGNRLLFMRQGRIAADYNAQEKMHLTKEDLLKLYT